MKAIFGLLIFCLCITGSAFGETPQPGAGASIKSFKDWKAEKVRSIENRISAQRNQVDFLRQKPVGGADSKAKAEGLNRLINQYEKQINQEKWNLEVAQDLSITDYLVLYLATQSSAGRFQQAASQLSPAEVAELVEAYAQSLGAQAPAESMASSLSPAGSSSAARGFSAPPSASQGQ